MVYLSIDVESATEYQLEYLLVDGLNLACRVLQLNKLVKQSVVQLVQSEILELKNQLVLPKTKCFNLRAMRARQRTMFAQRMTSKSPCAKLRKNVHLVHSHNMLHVLAITHTTYDHVKHVMI